MKFTKSDIEYMELALSLAAKGFGKTQPNPVVGCVIVKNGKIIGQGYHQKCGGAHAEVNALKNCKTNPKGATVYVTLDPCNHTGKTGPCTTALIQAGIKHVISATDDPHDKKHEGEKLLKKNGISFRRGLLSDESRLLLQPYLKWVSKKLPYVILKVATTLDGKIATVNGVSRGITSEASAKEVHRLRANVDAILTGSGTAITDNPHLGVRHVKGSDPLRILLDSSLSTPADSLMFRDENCIVYTTSEAKKPRIQTLQSKGIEIVIMGDSIELMSVTKDLFARGVYLLLIEAGASVMTSFLNEKLVDRYVQFIAPKLLGGEDSLTGFEGGNPMDFSKVVGLKNVEWKRFGEDMRVEGVMREY
ncbi:MAG: bifunctional diaminohydroxyphosphoribosylaminopyrimidine deaminase/5-amino-6-(5-phosphoribosylamino)uracil reductase RibD [Candidatus Peregrinibacteria bacterium]|nr:bifunctional diaminohydroxyphosphoribosylaminopyrimidine deaminase/5-amino-6-(5-phosphoribosylamino)uracil reductase RibD [Candidatus Peregrinibacteria bacterium]